ncbi:hypothetical protein B0H21DRAFT_281829 [Amylocystis lapponica]|nr:hypothetical protein B0H21DRAFT_281829 [Amylocystis lapponica]
MVILSLRECALLSLLHPFDMALIQLGMIGADKTENLKHARDMIYKAACGDGGAKPKPNLLVLPVRMLQLPVRTCALPCYSRDDRIRARTAVRRGVVAKCHCPDAFRSCEGSWHMAPRRIHT